MINKKKILKIFVFIFLFQLFLLNLPVANSQEYIYGDNLNVSVNLNEPKLLIDIVEDSIDLGNTTVGYTTDPQPINITNKGDVDVIIKPIINISDDIFSNLYIGTSRTTGYKKIGDFTGNISKSSTYGGENREDFWIKLNLTNYNGNLRGKFNKEVDFLIMSNNV